MTPSQKQVAMTVDREELEQAIRRYQSSPTPENKSAFDDLCESHTILSLLGELKAAEDAYEATGQRLLKLTPSGSEYFNRKGDGYAVDHEACLQVIEANRHRSLEWAHKCKDRDDKITDLEAALKAKDAEFIGLRDEVLGCQHVVNMGTGRAVKLGCELGPACVCVPSPPPAGRTGEV